MPVGGRNYMPASVLGEHAPHGPVSSTPVGNTLDQKAWANHSLAKWIPFFGVPEGVTPQSAGLGIVRDTYNMPEAYRGRPSRRIETILITKISESRKYPISRLLPLEDWDGSLEIVWDIWKFHDHRLARTPEQSVSRLLSSNFSEDRAYMVRYGIMFQLEHGFFDTARGKLQYAANIQQISNATSETLCHGGFIAMLASHPMSFDPGQMKTSVSSANDRDNLVRKELQTTARVIHQPNAIYFIWDELRQQINKNSSGLEPNAFVLPYGMMKYINGTRPENIFSIYTGKTFQPNRAPEINDSGVQIFESQEWRIGEKQVEDPVYQNRTFGFYSTFDDRHIQNILSEPVKFKTHMMDRKIFSDKADDWVDVFYNEHVAKCGLWKRDDTIGDDGKGGSDAWRSGKTRSSKPDDTVWTLNHLGLKFFSGNRSCGDYLKAVNKLHVWLKQLEKDDDRRVEFFARFANRAHGAAEDSAKLAASSGMSEFRGQSGAFRPGDSFVHPGLKTVIAKLADEDLLKRRDQDARAEAKSQTQSDSADLPSDQPFPQPPAATDDDVRRILTVLTERARRGEFSTFASGQNALAYYKRVWQLNDDGQLRPDTVKVLYGGLKRLYDGNWTFDLDQAVAALVIAQYSGSASEIKEAQALTSVTLGRLRSAPVVTTDLRDSNLLYAGWIAPASGPGSRPSDMTIVRAMAKYAFDRDDTSLKLLRGGNVELEKAAVQNREIMSPLQWHIWDALRDAAGSAAVNTVDDILPRLVTLSESSALLANAYTDLAKSAGGGDSSVETLVQGRAQLAQQERVAALASTDEKAAKEEQERINRVLSRPDIQAQLKRLPQLYSMNKELLANLYERLVQSPLGPTGKPDGQDSLSAHEFVVLMAIIEDIFVDEVRRARGDSKAEALAHQRLDVLVTELFQSVNANIRQLIVDHRAEYRDVFSRALSLKQAVDIAATGHMQLRTSLVRTMDVLHTLTQVMEQQAMHEIYNSMPEDFKKYLETRGSMSAVYADITKTDQSDVARLQNIRRLLHVSGFTSAKRGGDEEGAGAASKVFGGTEFIAEAVNSYKFVLPLLLALPIKFMGDLVKFGLENNMWPIIGIRAHRPYATWRMGSAIALIAGGTTGKTFKKKADFMLGDDPTRKMHMGHFTLYAKSVILRKDTLAIANNIYPCGYISGYDAAIWDLANPIHRSWYLDGEIHKADIMPCPVPINEPEPPMYYDITGTFAPGIRTPEDPEPYTFAAEMSRAWRWTHGSSNPLVRNFINQGGEALSNTIVFRDHFKVFTQDAHGTVEWKDIWGKGHRGRYNYAGIAKCWQGQEMWVKPLAGETSVVALTTQSG